MADWFQPRFADLVRNYTTTVGTGNFVLGATVNGYRSFASEVQPGESFYYSAVGVEKPAEFEVGRGTMQADGSISRDPIGGGLTSFSEGSKSVALVAASEWYETIHAAAHGALATAGNRTELAAMAASSGPVLLLEPGREGLFSFDGSDRSAEVSADTRQGIHVAPSSAPSGATGAWVRQYPAALDPRWFGAAGDGVADDTAAFQAALTYLESTSGGEIKLGRGTFAVAETLLLFASDVTIDARGATVVAANGSLIPMFYVGGHQARIVGGTWKVPFAGSRQFDVEGRNCHFDQCRIEDSPDQNGQQMYVRYGADGFQMTNCTMTGNNAALFVEASDVLIAFNEFEGSALGGDDAIAIKAIRGITENIRIIGNSIRRHSAIVSLGSEIGMALADDPAFSRRVRNVTVLGNVGELCAYGLYVKPGAVAADYRNGVVENITYSNNILYDSDGTVFERGIAITAGRGAIVRDVKGDNNIVVARASGTGATGVKAGMHIFSTGSGAAPVFENIDVELTWRDPHGGVASGGTAPGYPVANIVIVQPNGATMRKINLRVDGSGCAGAGIYIYAGIDDAVTISRARLDTINVAATTSGGITTNSRIRVRDDIAISMASGNPYQLVGGSTAEIVGNSDTVFFAEAIAAGTDQIRRPWSAPRNAFVHRIDLISSAAINQSADDTNYTQFEFRNIGGNYNIFHTISSKLTGGQSLPADLFNTLLRARDIANATSQGQCFFARDSHLYVNKNDFGSGNPVTRAYMRVHWAPY